MKQLSFFIITLLVTSSLAQTQFLGVTLNGGQNSAGTIFKTDGSGNNHSVIHDYFQFEGVNPMYNKFVQTPDGSLYGLARQGGRYDIGVLYKYDPATSVYTKTFDFDGTVNGSYPYGSLILASDGMLYGMTSNGGANSKGVLFQYNPTTSVYTKKVDFAGTTNGSLPQGSLLQATDGMLYGMTSEGGANNKGTLFQFDPVTSVLTKKIDFAGTTNGTAPQGSLFQASDGLLYGMTYAGGTNNYGTLFQYNTATSVLTKKVDLSGTATGGFPYGELIQAANGKLYGMTNGGGSSGIGVIFQFDLTTSIYTKKMDFTGTANGSHPYGCLVETPDGKLYGMAYEGGLNNWGVLFHFDPATSVYTKKIDFSGLSNGSYPFGSLMVASDGMLYGVTGTGGIAQGNGTCFEYNPATSVLTKNFDFSEGMNGETPSGKLLKASNGKLYGTTRNGGIYNMGTLFEFDATSGTYTKKFDFDQTVNGATPWTSLMQAADGMIYGLTLGGGANMNGVLFQYDPVNSVFTKKADFSSAMGNTPFGTLMQATDGMLYGLTCYGGANSKGTLFQYDPVNASCTKKFDFDGAVNGQNPFGALMQATDGKLYGTTSGGGANGMGVLFQYDPVTSMLTKQIDFDGALKGRNPNGSIIQAANGKLYGMTNAGGVNDLGVIYEYDLVGSTLTKKTDFNTPDGSSPYGDLMLAANTKLYGMTASGGANNVGVLFEFDPGTGIYTKTLDFNDFNGKLPGHALTEIPVTITTQTVTINNCAGDSIIVPFTLNGVYDPGNIFSAELSDASGSFTTPVVVGSVTSTITGSISATLPGTLNPGTAYRIRVTSTNPAVTGADNGMNITVNALPTITAATGNTLLCVGETTTLTASGTLQTYTWSTSENTQSIVISPTVTTSYSVMGTDMNGCRNSVTIVQDVDLCTALKNGSINKVTDAVYPNPNNGSFIIELIEPAQIVITTALGETILLKTREKGKQEINLQDQAGGIYFVKVNYSNGKSFINKIMVNR